MVKNIDRQNFGRQTQTLINGIKTYIKNFLK
jgi:hypothetical protein